MKTMSKLTKPYKRCYRDMIAYLGTKCINSKDNKIIREDIFQMLLDAQERNELPEHLFPNGPKAFCDDVAQSATRMRWYELPLIGAFTLFASFSVVLPLLVLFTALWPDENSYLQGTLLIIPLQDQIIPLLVALTCGFAGMTMRASVFSKKSVRFLSIILYILIPLICLIILGCLGLLDSSAPPITMNYLLAEAIIVVATCLFYAIEFAITRHFSKLRRK